MNSLVYPLTLYYDSACPLCEAEMHNLMLRNTAQRLRFIDVSGPDFDAAAVGIPMHDLLALMHARRADGLLVKGVDVFRLAYAAADLPMVSRVLTWPGLAQLADWIYPWVARNRYRFPLALVHIIFETSARRAAERAAEQHCSTSTSCHRPL